MEKAISHLRGAADDKLECDGSNRKSLGGGVWVVGGGVAKMRVSIHTADLGKDDCLAC